MFAKNVDDISDAKIMAIIEPKIADKDVLDEFEKDLTNHGFEDIKKKAMG